MSLGALLAEIMESKQKQKNNKQKNKAFELWKSGWIVSLKNAGSPKAEKILMEMMDEYLLVNIVDNDLVNGDVFSIFKELK